MFDPTSVSPRDYRSAMSMARSWNEDQAAFHYKRAVKEKNVYRREQHQRDANRHTRNAISIHRRSHSMARGE